MYTLPATSLMASNGLASWALIAGPPSPLNPETPVPATVDNPPLGDHRRTRSLPLSTMSTLPSGAMLTAVGKESAVALDTPDPAIVVMSLVCLSTRRTRWFDWSAMNTLPASSTATPVGYASRAWVAWS